jgi:hypothetical protein
VPSSKPSTANQDPVPPSSVVDPKSGELPPLNKQLNEQDEEEFGHYGEARVGDRACVVINGERCLGNTKITFFISFFFSLIINDVLF